MRVFYGSNAGHAHRYQCRGSPDSSGLCVGVGGVRFDKAVAALLLDAVAPLAVEASIEAAKRISQATDDVRRALQSELEEARYEVSLASRRYEAVDPAKRLVARELEARWETSLKRVAAIEERFRNLDSEAAARPNIDRKELLLLARDLPAVWNSPTTDAQAKQRLTRVLVREVIVDVDDSSKEVVATIHWAGGRHTQLRIARVRTGRYPDDQRPNAVEALTKLGGHWPDRELAVTLNRMRCPGPSGTSWTTVRVRELREKLGIPPFDPAILRPETITVDAAAKRLGICVGSVHRLIRAGILPGTQVMPSAPWQIPVATLTSESVQTGVREIVERRPSNFAVLQDNLTLRLPGT
jgi:hypothetical protein